MDNVRAGVNKLAEQRKFVDKLSADLHSIEEDAARTKDQGLKSSQEEYNKTKLQVWIYKNHRKSFVIIVLVQSYFHSIVCQITCFHCYRSTTRWLSLRNW